jgi:hypothetical protein
MIFRKLQLLGGKIQALSITWIPHGSILYSNYINRRHLMGLILVMVQACLVLKLEINEKFETLK